MPTRDTNILVDDPARLAVGLTAAIESILASRPAGSTWSVAVPGGSVAHEIVSRLAAAPLDWSRAHVFFVDERAVPPDDPESNWHVCRRVAAGSELESARWYRMEADANELDAACRRYVDLLGSIAGESLELDVVLLGVGEDGHVASIFPDRHLVDEAEPTIAVEIDAPKPPPRRMTMTLPLLARARLTCLAAFGDGKRHVMQQTLAGNLRLPAARLIRQARATLVLMDGQAARR